MFGSDIIEVAIGVVFVFLITSIVCASIREGLESILKTRAAYLEAGIRELLGDRGGSGLAGQLYSHPIISGLFSADYSPPPVRSRLSWLFARGRNLPSYIPSRNFALAVLVMGDVLKSMPFLWGTGHVKNSNTDLWFPLFAVFAAAPLFLYDRTAARKEGPLMRLDRTPEVRVTSRLLSVSSIVWLALGLVYLLYQPLDLWLSGK